MALRRQVDQLRGEELRGRGVTWWFCRSPFSAVRCSSFRGWSVTRILRNTNQKEFRESSAKMGNCCRAGSSGSRGAPIYETLSDDVEAYALLHSNYKHEIEPPPPVKRKFKLSLWETLVWARVRFSFVILYNPLIHDPANHSLKNDRTG